MKNIKKNALKSCFIFVLVTQHRSNSPQNSSSGSSPVMSNSSSSPAPPSSSPSPQESPKNCSYIYRD